MGIFRERQVYGFVYGPDGDAAGGGGDGSGGRFLNRRAFLEVLKVGTVAALIVESEKRRRADYTNTKLKKFEGEYGFVFESGTDVPDSRLDVLKRQLDSLPKNIRSSFDEPVILGFSEGGTAFDWYADSPIILNLEVGSNRFVRIFGLQRYEFAETGLVRGLVNKKMFQNRLSMRDGHSIQEGLRRVVGPNYAERLAPGLGNINISVQTGGAGVLFQDRDTVMQSPPARLLIPPIVAMRAQPRTVTNFSVARLVGDIAASYVSGRDVFARNIGTLAGTSQEDDLYRFFKEEIFEGREYKSPYVLETT